MSNLEAFSRELSDCKIDVAVCGFELLEEQNPWQLAETFRTQFDHPQGVSPTKLIGVGFRGRVDTVPDDPMLCTKISSPWLMRESYESGKQFPPSNLALQMNYMEALRGRLDITRRQTDHGVFIPKHYITASQQDGTAVMLMERVHGGSLGSRFDLDRDTELRVHDRILGAIGRSVLRFGLDDLMPRNRCAKRLRSEHVLVQENDEATSPLGANLHLVDLNNQRDMLTRLGLLVVR